MIATVDLWHDPSQRGIKAGEEIPHEWLIDSPWLIQVAYDGKTLPEQTERQPETVAKEPEPVHASDTNGEEG